MFGSSSTEGSAATVQAAREAREARAAARKAQEDAVRHTAAVLVLQRQLRRVLAVRETTRRRRAAYDTTATALAASGTAPPASDLLALGRALQRFSQDNTDEDARRLAVMLQLVLQGMPPRASASTSYFALALDKATLAAWLAQDVWLAGAVARALGRLGTTKEAAAEATTLLNALHALTDHTRWQLVPSTDPRAKAIALFGKSIQAQCFEHGILQHLTVWLRRVVAAPKLQCSPTALAAAVAIVQRICTALSWNDQACAAFADLLAAAPALIHYLGVHVPAVRDALRRDGSGALGPCLTWAHQNMTSQETLQKWDGNAVLYALGNIVDLALPSPSVPASLFPVAQAWLTHCGRFVEERSRGTVTSEHPLLGWFAGTTPRGELDAMPLVLGQLRKLWTPTVIRAALQPVWTETDRLLALTSTEDSGSAGARGNTAAGTVSSSSSSSATTATPSTTATPAPRPSGVGRLMRFFRGKPRAEDFADATAVMHISSVAALYDTLVQRLAPARAEITGGLAFLPELVPRLWTLMHHIGPKGGMQLFVDALGDLPREPLVPLLSLACSLTTHLLTVVHDDEIFERGDPFTTDQLLQVTAFLNRFLARWLWEFDGGATASASGSAIASGRRTRVAPVAPEARLMRAAARLLRLVLEIDARRAFVPVEHWRLKSPNSSQLLARYRQEQRGTVPTAGASRPEGDMRAHHTLTTLPHLVGFRDRVTLLRQEAEDDRVRIMAALGEVRRRPRIRIRRTAILTDGFRELASIPVTNLKDAVRVAFVNEQGLDEAGIDEEGLFKEFLEATLKEGFDPGFGLFRVSEDNRLYPSPTSGAAQPEHLPLFEYLGRMLGKMVYEGYVVDLPLAAFFLNRLLGRRNTLDDLPSLDADVARNLALVRDYPGDVADLGLTFAVDDEILGQMVTTPLRPGGGDIDVTQENRLLYVHLVADYRLNRQMEAQVAAFLRGFHALVQPGWLRLFHAREVQRLVGGDDVPLDVDDLRRHAVYADGYHGSHRVIKWLWEVVQRDLSREEQEAFLRFVTSCSKPPVLGFGSLRPAFTVRCLADGASEDSYSLGTAMLNLFSRGQDTSRLPSASTCFNLLKLPPYKSKRVLREKLRYAINAGAGFELA